MISSQDVKENNEQRLEEQIDYALKKGLFVFYLTGGWMYDVVEDLIKECEKAGWTVKFHRDARLFSGPDCLVFSSKDND